MNRFGLTSIYSSNPCREGDYSYTVKKGDSLYKLSKEYDVNINDFINANDLTSNLIYPNQVLIIPKKVPSGSMYFEEYVTKPNETLDLISEKNDVSISDLGKYNDLSKLILVESQVLNIPKVLTRYVVKDGDTLDSILYETKMTLDELIEANIEEWIKPGNVILVKRESD